MLKFIATLLPLTLIACVPLKHSACETCGLGLSERQSLETKNPLSEEEQWAEYFSANMVNIHFGMLDQEEGVLQAFLTFHNNTNESIDNVTVQFSNEVWVDNMVSEYGLGCNPYRDCVVSLYFNKDRFCHEMNGNVWLTHIQGNKIKKPIRLMPYRSHLCNRPEGT